jgi:hypothetical protein
MWHIKNSNEKITFVEMLHQKRKALQADAVKRKASTKKKKVTKMTFKSKELEELFNKMPDDMKKLF